MNSKFWNDRYAASDEYVFGTAPNDFLARCALRIPAGGRVLCLAEGEGRNAVFLAELGYDVTAVDQSAAGLDKAAALAAARGVRIRTEVADLADYRIEPESWAGIVSIFTHLPQELRARTHAAAVAGLRPDGVFILEAYTPEQVKWKTGGPVGSPELLMTLEALRAELAGLNLIIAHEINRDVVEGSGHTGHAAVVQICGRKRHMSEACAQK